MKIVPKPNLGQLFVIRVINGVVSKFLFIGSTAVDWIRTSSIFFMLGVFLVSPVVLAQTAKGCQPASIPNSCQFYTDCLEGKKQCGDNGYAIGYGVKYCQVFNSLNLSPDGEKWITNAMGCLQDQLVDHAYDGGSCDEIRTKAFNSHVRCYVDNGFCNLSGEDKLAIVGATIWDVVSSASGIDQAVKTLNECL